MYGWGASTGRSLRLYSYREYWLGLRSRCESFDEYWRLVYPRLPVCEERVGELKLKAREEFEGVRGWVCLSSYFNYFISRGLHGLLCGRSIMYDAPYIASQVYEEDPLAIEDKMLESVFWYWRVNDATAIQKADPTVFCHNKPMLWRTEPWSTKGPLEVYADFRLHLAKAIKNTQQHLSLALVTNNLGHDLKVQHYLNCREVAGWHQAIELLEQGMGAIWAAMDDQILIFQGNRCALTSPISFVLRCLTALEVLISMNFRECTQR